MSVDFKEYSRLRDIAVKRLKRLEEKGNSSYTYEFPTVKEVRGMSEQEQSRRFSALSGFLESGPSLSKRRERTKASKEERAKDRKEYQRDYRRRKVAQEYEKPGHPKKYQSYLKGLKTMGLDLKPSQLPKPAQILADYQQFESDQLGIATKADEMHGRSTEEVLKAWRNFIDNRRG